jgi:hypothetical protein
MKRFSPSHYFRHSNSLSFRWLKLTEQLGTEHATHAYPRGKKEIEMILCYFGDEGFVGITRGDETGG